MQRKRSKEYTLTLTAREIHDLQVMAGSVTHDSIAASTHPWGSIEDHRQTWDVWGLKAAILDIRGRT